MGQSLTKLSMMTERVNGSAPHALHLVVEVVEVALAAKVKVRGRAKTMIHTELVIVIPQLMHGTVHSGKQYANILLGGCVPLADVQLCVHSVLCLGREAT